MSATEVERPASALGWRLPALVFVFVLLSGLSQGSESVLAPLLGTAFLPAGFALMALLTRLGDTQPSARPLGFVLLWGMLSALALGSLALVVLQVVEPGSLNEAGQEVEFVAGGESRLSFMMALLAVGSAATMIVLLQKVREVLRDIIPVDPTVFSHAIALAAAIALTIMPLLPLFVLGKPPLPPPAHALPPGSPPMAMPSFPEHALELGWFAAATLLVAGRGAGRSWSSAQARLGLVRPPVLMLLIAVGIGGALALLLGRQASALGLTSAANAWLPVALPWSTGVSLSLLAAVGTELAYRGLLQPRLGLVLTNLVLTAPLAWTATWNLLFVVFAIGCIFGWMRIRGGTVTSLAAHATFLLGTIVWRAAGLGFGP